MESPESVKILNPEATSNPSVFLEQFNDVRSAEDLFKAVLSFTRFNSSSANELKEFFINGKNEINFYTELNKIFKEKFEEILELSVIVGDFKKLKYTIELCEKNNIFSLISILLLKIRLTQKCHDVFNGILNDYNTNQKDARVLFNYLKKLKSLNLISRLEFLQMCQKIEIKFPALKQSI